MNPTSLKSFLHPTIFSDGHPVTTCLGSWNEPGDDGSMKYMCFLRGGGVEFVEGGGEKVQRWRSWLVGNFGAPDAGQADASGLTNFCPVNRDLFESTSQHRTFSVSNECQNSLSKLMILALRYDLGKQHESSRNITMWSREADFQMAKRYLGEIWWVCRVSPRVMVLQ